MYMDFHLSYTFTDTHTHTYTHIYLHPGYLRHPLLVSVFEEGRHTKSAHIDAHSVVAHHSSECGGVGVPTHTHDAPATTTLS